ncbi:uncharacterized protein LOC122260294 [Penaeus japonicus]|uniref:uncharacterized protein LOC122260294 n=1 Tax=Penaeus japonicus TaxID=27405 RepID=UPI001C70CC1C|nr:uncharacterized protein LOC122260294 [Penaeus japonicus]
MRFLYAHIIVILLLPIAVMAAVSGLPDRSKIRVQLLGNIPCVFHSKDCATRKLCDTGRVHRVCTGCYVGPVYIDVSNFCNGQGMLYDAGMRECVSATLATRLCPDVPPPVRIAGRFDVHCSDTVTRPKHDWIVDLYCTEYDLCTAGNVYQSSKQLCTNFYQCKKGLGGSWYTELRNCIGDDRFFNYETDSCEYKPEDRQLCR